MRIRPVHVIVTTVTMMASPAWADCTSPVLLDDGAVDVAQTCASGTGTGGDPFVDWESCVSACGDYQDLYFAPGTWNEADTVTIHSDWWLHGGGVGATFIVATNDLNGLDAFYGDNVQNVAFSDMTITNNGSSEGDAAIDLQRSKVIWVTRMSIGWFDYAIRLDATTGDTDEVHVTDNHLGGDVDGVVISPSEYCMTQSIWIDDNQFDMGEESTASIEDHCGAGNTFAANDFNAGEYGIVLANVGATAIEGNHIEGQSSGGIYFDDHDYADESYVWYHRGSYAIAIRNNDISEASDQSDIVVKSADSPPPADIHLSDNLLLTVDQTAVIANGNLIAGLVADGNDLQDGNGSTSLPPLLAVGTDTNTSQFSMVQTKEGLGLNTAHPAQSFDLRGAEATRFASYSASGSNPDINLPNTSYLRVTAGGPFTIGGFQHGTDGRKLVIYNASNQTMTIKNEDSPASTAANRITTLTGANVVLRSSAKSAATLIYDSTDSRWILVSTN